MGTHTNTKTYYHLPQTVQNKPQEEIGVWSLQTCPWVWWHLGITIEDRMRRAMPSSTLESFTLMDLQEIAPPTSKRRKATPQNSSLGPGLAADLPNTETLASHHLHKVHGQGNPERGEERGDSDQRVGGGVVTGILVGQGHCVHKRAMHGAHCASSTGPGISYT